MSALSIIVLSVLAALFALLLLASIAALIYAHIVLRREVVNFSLLIKSSGVKMESLIAGVQGEKIQQAAQGFLQQIPRQAALVSRIEKATLLFIDVVKHLQGEIEISGSDLDRARESGLGPESYATAAPGEHYVTRSRVAEGDAAALLEESAFNSTDAESPDDQA